MNRRARTDSVVRDNKIFEIRTMRDGYYTGREAHYYRRNTGKGVTYTGPYAGLKAN